ncbi:hypothetical protein AB0I77_15835 [Streptomyces sp. NPDC050619]|uniref:hypothetical protein n=1 Tax=Streptomyces sp. NPDC050619 TaxID=3157214 RepID=UPI003433A50B
MPSPGRLLFGALVGWPGASHPRGSGPGVSAVGDHGGHADGTRPTTERQIPAWASTVGPGWATLLDQLHQDLTALAPDYQIDSLSSRFGGLRIYLADLFDEDGEFDSAFADRAGALVDAAEAASEKTCEQCGHSGRPRFHGDQTRTWIVTLCETCRARSRTPRVPDTAAADHPPLRC